ncbi:hypothetical protein TUMEXPCC7403_07245 [Tumidithrix helvetica PCC 7403]|uniref:hypothetical protein n=1 Tax=Tumidithrix helvetica TaxID=3457545 RepID=UPI003C9FB52C
MSKYRFIAIPLLGIVIWLLGISPASANSWPPMAVWLLQIPLSAGIISYGLGLIGIVTLEGFILAKREQVHLGKAILFSGLANLCSLVMGFLVIMGIAGLPYGATWIPMAIAYFLLVIFSWLFFSKKRSQDSIIPPLLLSLLGLCGWGLIWFCGLICSLFLLGSVGVLNPATVAGKPFPDLSVPFYVNILQLLGVVVFLGIGFAMSVVSEGFCITKLLSNSSDKLKRTVLIMNLRSYGYIAIPITLAFMLLNRRL